MTRDEYEDANETICKITGRAHIPPARDLLRGGIIGSVEVIDVCDFSTSPWFFGPRGLVLRNPEVWTFMPAAGALGYFKWRHDHDMPPTPPARWMIPENERQKKTAPAITPDLFV